MKPPPSITQSQVLRDMASVLALPSDAGMTAVEMGELLGWHPQRVRKALNAAKAKGLLVTGRATRERLDGRTHTLTVYRFKGRA
jgi:predicted transcriptional regulator